MKYSKSNIKSKVPKRVSSAARGAALGGAAGAFLGRKEAVVLAGAGAYVGTRIGEVRESRAESEVVEDEDEEPLVDVESQKSRVRQWRSGSEE